MRTPDPTTPTLRRRPELLRHRTLAALGLVDRHLPGEHDQLSHGRKGVKGFKGLPDMFGFVGEHEGYLATDRVKGDGDVDPSIALIKLSDAPGDVGIEVGTPRVAWDPKRTTMIPNPILHADDARAAAKHLRELAAMVDKGVKGKPSSRISRTQEKLEQMLASTDKYAPSPGDRVDEDLPLTYADLRELLAQAVPKASGASTRRKVEGMGYDEFDTTYDGEPANLWMEIDNSGTGIIMAAKEGREPWDPVEDDLDGQATAGLSPKAARELADKLERFAEAAHPKK